MSVTIEQDLKEYLARIETKLDKMQDDITTIKISNGKMENQLGNLDKRVDKLEINYEKIETRLNTISGDVSDLKGSKSLIIPIVVAVLTSLITLLVRAIPNP